MLQIGIFIFKAEYIQLYICTTLSVGGHLDYFYNLAILNNAGVNMVQIYLPNPDFNSLGYIHRSGIADNTVFYF